MYQSDVQRFERSKNTDLFVTFFPLVLAFGLRGFLLKTGLPEAALFAAQALLAVFLAAAFLLSHHCYFRLFRYTVAERGGAATPRSRSPLSGSAAKSRGFTSGSCAAKCSIWPRRMSAARRMGSPRLPTASRSFPPGAPAGSITGRRGPSTARPFIRTNGRAAVLRRWTGQDKAENRPEAAGSC